jgi:hypothetical protein
MWCVSNRGAFTGSRSPPPIDWSMPPVRRSIPPAEGLSDGREPQKPPTAEHVERAPSLAPRPPTLVGWRSPPKHRFDKRQTSPTSGSSLALFGGFQLREHLVSSTLNFRRPGTPVARQNRPTGRRRKVFTGATGILFEKPDYFGWDGRESGGNPAQELPLDRPSLTTLRGVPAPPRSQIVGLARNAVRLAVLANANAVRVRPPRLESRGRGSRFNLASPAGAGLMSARRITG